jgi:hypothetical protein
MTGFRRARRLLARMLLVTAAIAAAGAGVAAVGGGFTLSFSGGRLSLHTPLKPMLVAIAAAALAWLCADRADRRRMGTALNRVAIEPQRLAPWIAVALAVAVTATAVVAGSFVASGADAYGYLSQADHWRRGALVVPQPFARDAWPFPADSLAPLGYQPRRVDGVLTGDLVPIYSPGHPLLLALLQAAGGAKAKFALVPLLSGVAIWATYLLGRRFAGPLAGVSAAWLLACSPTFLFEAVSPTSDAPGTAWWAIAIASLLAPGRASILAAGLVSGIAILTRPNLVFLAGILGGWLWWESRARPAGETSAWPRSAIWLYAPGVALACLAIALLNWHLYGSPLQSGYGSLTTLFTWQHLAPNLATYPRLLLQNETPFVLFALVAVALPARAAARGTAAVDARGATIAWTCFSAALVAMYLFYIPEFASLRFLLPAYPPLLVMATAGLLVVARLAGRPRLSGLVALAVAAAIGWHGLGQARQQGIFTYWKSELRYHTLGEFIGTTLPERAAILSMQHSGSIRYYAGRLTVRYDAIPPDALDAVLVRLRTLGYHPYLAIDVEEADLFRERFGGHSALAPLDWLPMAIVHGDRVRVYDLTDRAAGRPDAPRTPVIVPSPAGTPWARWRSAR